MRQASLFTVFLFIHSLQAASLASLYSDLSGPACHDMKRPIEEGSLRECAGVAGYKLLVADDDSRMSVSIVSLDKSSHPLNYWDSITKGFSHLGTKAEWRVKSEAGKTVPVALIVRVYAESQSNGKSYLAVAKVSPTGACVVKRIDGGPGANERAREAADLASTAPCMPKETLKN